MKRNRLLNNKSFIDKACSIKMAGYWLRFSLPFFIVREEVKVQKGKKRTKRMFSHHGQKRILRKRVYYNTAVIPKMIGD